MSSCVVTIAIHAGMPAVAVRHGFTALKDYIKMRNFKEVCVCVDSVDLCSLCVFWTS